jgi:hypothetical protein
MRTAALLTAAVLIAGCGSSSSKKTATTNGSSTSTSPRSSTSAGSPTGSAPSKSGSLTVTGSQTLSLTEDTNGSPCQPGAPDHLRGVVGLTGPTSRYQLQIDVAPTVSVWPKDAKKYLVAFFSVNDSTKEWSIGTAKSATAHGTLTVNGHHGRLDLDMVPDTPTPNPSLGPIHIKGTFTC